MSIRVTQNSMYSTMTSQMQKSLGAYMDSTEQGSSQKKINRPSDDPAGMYRVLMTRDDINATKQFQSNVDTARGWLNLADNVLGTQVSNQLTRLKSLAEQASTGTYNAENRRQIAAEAREIFGQMLNLSNTEFEGKSIFAGHRYNLNAYEEGLALCSWDDTWNQAIQDGAYAVAGASASSIAVQFLSDGQLSDGVAFRWSDDGGSTWHGEDGSQTVATVGGKYELDLGNGVVMTMDNDLAVQAADLSQGSGARNGTTVFVRPQAFYQGDDNDTPADKAVTVMGTLSGGISTTASGDFGGNVLVRLDGQADLSAGGNAVSYSYSTDSGTTWIPATAETTTVTDAGGSSFVRLRLPVPGGYINVDDSGAGGVVDAGTQLLVRPDRASLNLEVMKGTYVPINNVGKDIFGGSYDGKPVLPEAEDLFGMVGDFVAYLENNIQEGCQRTLERITSVQTHILTETARIGGLENRIDTASDVLSFQKLDQEERLSYIEDIDLTELLNKLTRQQLTYQTVLQSSSKIMQLSLSNYL